MGSGSEAGGSSTEEQGRAIVRTAKMALEEKAKRGQGGAGGEQELCVLSSPYVPAPEKEAGIYTATVGNGREAGGSSTTTEEQGRAIIRVAKKALEEKTKIAQGGTGRPEHDLCVLRSLERFLEQRRRKTTTAPVEESSSSSSSSPAVL